MSATNRGVVRQKDDAYYTPKWAVHRVLEWLYEHTPEVFSGRWMEPCVGIGNIPWAVSEWHTKPACWEYLDINPPVEAVRMGARQADFLKWPPYFHKNKFILTNPPYSLAREFIDRGMQIAEFGCYLLRINFLGSVGRATWWRDRPATVLVLPNRPIFSLNKEGKLGSDATEYAWFLFGLKPEHQAFRRVEVLRVTSPEEIKAANQALIARSRT